MQRYLYPAGHELAKLSSDAINTKIARHSQCSVCDSTCNGLHPLPHVKVILDSEAQELLDLDGNESLRYLSDCTCGHGLREHGAHIGRLGRDEHVRRARVAIRLDEMLAV